MLLIMLMTGVSGGMFPKGYLPVYVGKDFSVTFVIEAEVVSHPLFAQLLQISVEEFAYEQTGALRIPCDIVLFETILNQIKNTRITVGLSNSQS
ncbi:hypothetical protein SUGI_0462480 [Cryptomeria japonica]|nr:hypothetical protein SUGI_0462480 [Cryptomeria japonica]